MHKYCVLFIVCLLFFSCFPDKFKNEAGKKFGDQNFKTSIALIELYNTREGEYPDSLSQLKFTGDWDQAALQSVKYTKLSDGYELDLVNTPFGGIDSLKYSSDFWKGLGLKKSNIKK